MKAHGWLILWTPNISTKKFHPVKFYVVDREEAGVLISHATASCLGLVKVLCNKEARKCRRQIAYVHRKQLKIYPCKASFRITTTSLKELNSSDMVTPQNTAKTVKNSPVMGWGRLSNVWKCQVVKNMSNMCSIAHVPHHAYPHLDLCITMLTCMPHHPCVPLPMCPIGHVSHYLCLPSRSMHYYAHMNAPSPMCPITHVPFHPYLPSRSMHYYAHMPHHLCVPLPMCPISHVPHYLCHLDLCIIMPHHVFNEQCQHILDLDEDRGDGVHGWIVHMGNGAYGHNNA